MARLFWNESTDSSSTPAPPSQTQTAVAPPADTAAALSEALRERDHAARTYLFAEALRGLRPENVERVRDVLNAAFTYQTGTLKLDNTVTECAAADCTGGEEASIFSAIDDNTASTDAVDGDDVSITGSTIDAGNQSVANGQLDLLADKVWAILFTVEVN